MSTYFNIVNGQREFFRSGKTSDLEFRKNQLKRLRNVIVTNKEKLCEAVFRDLRRDSKASYSYELASVLIEIDYMLDNLKEWASPTNVEKTFITMLDAPQIVREPKGVILIIGPWNYPLNTLLMPLVAVLAAGNTAVLKPSEIASNTAQVVDEVFSNAFDKEYLAVIQGGVMETTLLLEQRFDHIVFTGSTKVARHVMEAASKHLTPCTLELGGKSPVIVEADADIQITARRLAWGKWLNCGQTCLAPDYVLCTNAVRSNLVNELKRVLDDFYGTKPAESKDYSRIINEANFDRLASLLNETRGQIIHQGGDLDTNDLFIPPIILEVSLDDPIMKTEIFGPILPIITVRSFEEALTSLRDAEKPLAIYLFTRDERKIQRLIEETSSGSVCVNDVILQLAVDTLPFGGIGNSGMGRYRGKFGFDEFTHEKAVLKRMFFGDGIAAARYPPLTDEKLRKLEQLTGKRRAVPRFLKRLFMPAIPYLLAGFLLSSVFNTFYRSGN